MPSLHFGWALLIGIGLWLARPAPRRGWRLARPTVGLFAGLIVVGQFFAVVLTGNHWILDAVAGTVVAGAGLAVALVWASRSERKGKNDAAVDIG
jgi:peptidoglycan/LPS O-acetylase OafA/YrhL